MLRSNLPFPQYLTNFYPQISGEGRIINFHKTVYLILLSGLFFNFCDDKKFKEPKEYKILFGISNELYIIDGDGTNQLQITNNELHENRVIASPDGTKLKFETHGDYGWNIWMMNIDGSNLKNISSGFIDLQAQFSPDGSQLVFDSYHRDEGHGIYLMDVDGNNVKKIPNVELSGGNPIFLPNGTQIMYCVYSSNFDSYGIHLIDINGENKIRVTGNDRHFAYPQLSPDGSKIIFYSSVDLFIVDSDGSNLTNLTNNNRHGIQNCLFTPDGNNIICSDAEGVGDGLNIIIMDIDGQNRKRLTNIADMSELVFDVSPDGEKILLSLYSWEVKSDILIMDIDGNNQLNVTNDSTRSTYPIQFLPIP